MSMEWDWRSRLRGSILCIYDDDADLIMSAHTCKIGRKKVKDKIVVQSRDP